MILSKKSGSEKRLIFKKLLGEGKLLKFPGSWSPLVSMLIEREGFDGVYISGAVLSNDLGLPDIGLTTLTEVSERGRAISGTTVLPSIIDIDTGFGEPANVARTVREIEEIGVSGCHLEDQVNPKRCGHLENKQLIAVDIMCKKIKAAADAKLDSNFLLIARTDSRASEGLEASIQRAKAYIDAGADMIFPEALIDEKEFEKFRKEIKVPLMANMTEFGKSPLLDEKTLTNLGYNLVIYPVTTFRLALKAVELGLKVLKKDGTQKNILDKMLTRKELYEVLNYEEYNRWDTEIYNFKV
jgi:methylisocitrate lyase